LARKAHFRPVVQVTNQGPRGGSWGPSRCEIHWPGWPPDSALTRSRNINAPVLPHALVFPTRGLGGLSILADVEGLRPERANLAVVVGGCLAVVALLQGHKFITGTRAALPLSLPKWDGEGSDVAYIAGSRPRRWQHVLWLMMTVAGVLLLVFAALSL
jgi:hypothetical protein